MNAQAAALAAIDAAFAEPVSYTVSASRPVTLMAIWSDVPVEQFDAPASNTMRRVTCEIRKDLLPERPTKADRIARNGVNWKPTDIIDLDQIGRWSLVLEKA